MEIIVAGVVALAVVVWLLTRKRQTPGSQRPAAPGRPDAPAAHSQRPTSEGVTTTTAPFQVAVVPDEVQALQSRPVAAVADADWMQRLRDIPRPPRALQQLTSPTFLQKATSVELADLVLSEPHIAAKVLATVNSPLYGLRTPVAHIGQGITFLGLNTVRSICLRYLLNEAFPAASGELRPVFDRLWIASAVGSELCAKLSQKLGMSQGGVMVTQIVLSYLGPMAALTVMPLEKARALAAAPLITRTQVERDTLGMSGAEIGRRVMTDWGLPESVVQSVSDMDHMLDTPIAQPSSDWTATALSYWCARMGERMARGELTHPDALSQWYADTHLDTAIACHYLRQTLGDRLTAALQDPVVSPLMASAIDRPAH